MPPDSSYDASSAPKETGARTGFPGMLTVSVVNIADGPTLESGSGAGCSGSLRWMRDMGNQEMP